MNQKESSDAETTQLVEHFFRHEYANLVSTLTRAFGFSQFDLVEDMVSAAMVQAMNSWKISGVPQNPSGWIHTVARNRILDHFRREKVHSKALMLSRMNHEEISESAELLIDKWLDENSLPDNILRMMFVCCHPSLDQKSQIALTLKILCGFNETEISRGLLSSKDAIKKRLQRAKSELAKNRIEVEFPDADELPNRLFVVHEVLYLMFNEGYSTSHGIEPIRDDVCEEAARLCHLLCNHNDLSTPESKALLSLMLFHASRLDSRTDENGNIVLLQDQDRSRWDHALIKVADDWLIRSASSEPSRYHLEAAISRIHCVSKSNDDTDWNLIVRFYNRLIDQFPSAIYRLNRAIAIAQMGDHQLAMSELGQLRGMKEMKDYYLLDCACGYVCQKAEDYSSATEYYLAALSGSIADHQRNLVEKKLNELSQKGS